MYKQGEWYLGTDAKPYDNNGKCLTEGGLFPFYQGEDGKRAKKPEATRVTIIKQDNKPGPKPKDNKDTAQSSQQSDLDTTQEAMEDETEGNTGDQDTAEDTVVNTDNSGNTEVITINSGITVIEPPSTARDEQQMETDSDNFNLAEVGRQAKTLQEKANYRIS